MQTLLPAHAAPPGGPPAEAFNWMGDVAVPIGILVASLLFTFVLASVARRQAREDLTFQRDSRYADEFLIATEHITWWSVIAQRPEESLEEVTRVNHAFDRFCRFASGAEDLGPYMTAQWSILHQMQARAQDSWRRYHSEVDAHFPTGQSLIIGDFSDHDKAAVNAAIREMQTLARDWPFPEKRRDCLITALSWHLTHWAVRPTDEALAIDRLLFGAAPPRRRTVRFFRRLGLWARGLRDDYRYGRLPTRWTTWRTSASEHRRMSRAQRLWRRNEKASARDKVAQRKLYEAALRHHSSRNEVPSWLLESEVLSVQRHSTTGLN